MKAGKWLLLSGAAMTVMVTAARADDLDALKAQIEALQSRVSQLEAQPEAAMPSGYSLMAIRDGQGTYEGVLAERNADKVRENSGFTLSVLPTADAAPAAEVSVSGEIRTALIYTDFSIDVDPDVPVDLEEDNLDLKVRGRIFIKGKADTAVGEVGGYFRLQADGGGFLSDYSENTKMNKAYGWWKFAPNWELMAGYNDNTAALQVGWDWVAASGPTKSFGPSNVNNEQLRLTYADGGPLSFAISVEDADNDTSGGSDLPNLQAYLMYSTDAFTAQVVGLVQDDQNGDDIDWALGGGATVGISDGFKITAGGVFGEGTTSYLNNLAPLTVDDEFWGASLGILANLSEDTRIELGVGYEEDDFLNANALGFGGGVYWDPVSQVTLGVGATYVETEIEFGTLVINDEPVDVDIEADSLEIWFGTWLRFP